MTIELKIGEIHSMGWFKPTIVYSGMPSLTSFCITSLESDIPHFFSIKTKKLCLAGTDLKIVSVDEDKIILEY